METAPASGGMRIISEDEFGGDHERLLLYLECICVDDRGYPALQRMRCNVGRHPERSGDYHRPEWKESYSTKTKDGTVVSGHDDWDSIDDLIRAGLLEWHGTGLHPRFELTDKGWAREHELRRRRAERSLRS